MKKEKRSPNLLLLVLLSMTLLHCGPVMVNQPKYDSGSVSEENLHAVGCQFVEKTASNGKSYTDLDCAETTDESLKEKRIQALKDYEAQAKEAIENRKLKSADFAQLIIKKSVVSITLTILTTGVNPSDFPDLSAINVNWITLKTFRSLLKDQYTCQFISDIQYECEKHSDPEKLKLQIELLEKMKNIIETMIQEDSSVTAEEKQNLILELQSVNGNLTRLKS